MHIPIGVFDDCRARQAVDDPPDGLPACCRIIFQTKRIDRMSGILSLGIDTIGRSGQPPRCPGLRSFPSALGLEQPLTKAASIMSQRVYPPRSVHVVSLLLESQLTIEIGPNERLSKQNSADLRCLSSASAAIGFAAVGSSLSDPFGNTKT